MFSDRNQAGRLLAEKLKHILATVPRFADGELAVVAIPRGGVPVAAQIAIALNAPLDVLVAKKIRAPDSPELAIGAVSSTGEVVLNQSLSAYLREKSVIDEYVKAQETQTKALIVETKRLEEHWLTEAKINERPSIAGKCVILVDDGIATGMTTLCAIKSVACRNPGILILATPVIPSDTYFKLNGQCDLLAALLIAEEFSAVGQFYDDFHQVEDREVIESLRSVSAVRKQ